MAGSASDGDSEADFAEWMGKVNKVKVECWIDDPQVFGSMFSKYTSYRMRTVLSTGGEFDIRRRFSDFVWMHDLLEAKFVGMILPALPEKRSVGNLGQEFVAKRMRGLQLFCARLVKIPFLRADGAVWTFLTDDGERWEAARKLTPKDFQDGGVYGNDPCAPSVEMAPLPLEGAVRWRAAVQAYPLPHNSDLILSEAQRQVAELDDALTALMHSGRRLVERSLALAEEARAFHGAFQALARVEEACASGTWHPKSTPDLAMTESMGAKGVAAWSHTLRHQPRALEALCLEYIRYEQAQCRAVKQLMETREQLRSRHGKAAKEVVRARAAAAGSSAASAASVMAQAEFAELFITRALLASELDRWAKDRLIAMREMLGIFAAGQGDSGETLNAVWARMLDEALPAIVRKDPERHKRAKKTALERSRTAIKSVEAALGTSMEDYSEDIPSGGLVGAPDGFADHGDESGGGGGGEGGGGGGGGGGWFSWGKKKDTSSSSAAPAPATTTSPPAASTPPVPSPSPPPSSSPAPGASGATNPFGGAAMGGGGGGGSEVVSGGPPAAVPPPTTAPPSSSGGGPDGSGWGEDAWGKS